MVARLMPRLFAVAVCLVISLIVGLIVYLNSAIFFWGWTDRNIEKSKVTGNALIEKINLFHKKNGRFPKDLDELVPAYIASVQAPSAGERQWAYGASGDMFTLSFSMPKGPAWHGYPSCHYDSRYKFWYLDE
jgi:hypothetical protein